MHNFTSYYKLGLSIFPLRGKQPLISWKRFQDNRADVEEVNKWDVTPHNIGIATGHVSEILVVDVDGVYPPDWPDMPKTWTAKTKKGFHYYFYMSPDQDFRNSTRIAENVDIRANGGYVVAPPSKHPDGGLYSWEIAPEDATLAEIPDWLIEVLNKHDKRLFEAPNHPKVDKPVVRSVNSSDNDQAYIDAAVKAECDILRTIGEGGRNDQLNKSTFALAGLLPAGEVSAILTPIALEIGLNAVETRKTIDSGCQGARPREIPQRIGFVSNPEAPEEMPLIVKNILERNGKVIKQSEISSDLISGAPSFMGDFIRWSLATSFFPQPTLSLAAAIALAGHLMAHKVATETDLRTNFYTMGVAESGAGKEHARQCVAKLLDAAGHSDGLSGDPASSPAVINLVSRAGGAALIQIDEMGHYIKSIGGDNSASHNKMVAANFMKLYSSAGGMYIGQEYANNETNGGRSDIDQPCLNIYGTTIPDNLYGALSKESAYDGFLSRWMIFETSRFDIEGNVNAQRLGSPPDGLVESAKFWIDQPKYHAGAGGQDGNLNTYTMIKPRVIEFTDTARKQYYEFRTDCRRKMANSSDKIDRAFWNRTAEHAAKLALVGHVGDKICTSVFDWAVELSNALTISAIDNIKANVYDNAYEAELQSIFKLIKGSGAAGISKSEVTRKTQRMERRKRQDIIETLIESGDIREEKASAGSSGRNATMYYC